MRTLFLFALLVPCIALGAPRKVTRPAKGQAAEQVKAQPGDDRPGQSQKAHGDPHVDNAPAAQKANAKVEATSKAAEAPAQK